MAAPDLAEYGEERLHDQVAYLATIKPDGAPRLHPVRPIVTGGHLFLFMEADSPKLHDLSRDGRYVLHCTATGDQPWDLREFAVEGTARSVVDLEMRNQANTGTGLPRDDHFVLLELQVTSALYKVYGSDGQPQRRRWHADPPD
ncbi:MAG TPA: pyridoxamine 5'-phosphate oxidase family protein [Acidimicrobiia bacterium]|nr:pyridoxamine 5'-phosphate oxidase family protein [Acidimicrobiia bacterium]